MYVVSELVIGITDKNGDSFGKPQPRRILRNCTVDFTQSKSELQMSNSERAERPFGHERVEASDAIFLFRLLLVS